MKLFKIDGYKIYEKNFKNMLLKDFFDMTEVPKGVDSESMKRFSDYISQAKDLNLPENVTVDQAMLELEILNSDTE